MKRLLEGQVAIVTGGARGIGRGIAQRLSQDGCRIVLWDCNLSVFDAASSGFSPVFTYSVDVADPAAVEAAFAATLQAVERIDILINDAGINGPVMPVPEYPLDAWNRVLAVNLNGVFHCCRAVVPHMCTHGYGRIVNIASIAGKEGMPGIAAYSASKAGVIGFTKALAKELVHSGVLVNCIAPVITETELLKEMTPEHIASSKSKIPMGRFLQISEIAALVAWMAGPECTFTTGFTFDISGGRATY
jgi:NAD(P)-dependent dehydrogenase (short-subunit alcohol dehydrogenase family)